MAGHQRTAIPNSGSSSLVGLDLDQLLNPPRDWLVVTMKMGSNRQSIDLKPLSLSHIGLALDQLRNKLGGRSWFLSCWECYRKGVDPSWFFDCNTTINLMEPKLKGLESSGWSRGKFVHRGPELGNVTLNLLKSTASLEKILHSCPTLLRSRMVQPNYYWFWRMVWRLRLW